MRRSNLLILATCLLACVPAFAQERPRYSLDNFDTARGVHVTPKPTPEPVIARSRRSRRNSRSRLVEKTAMVNSTAPKGLADREIARTLTSNLPSTRLVMGSVAGMKGFTTGDAAIDSYIVDSSRRYRIDPLLIYAQMHQESSFKLRALSNKGARGLMQLMPGTARRMGVTNIYDPKQNIEGGVKYMRFLLDLFGQDVNLALAGYNAGEGAVMKYGNSIPPYSETREYVRRISTRYLSISDGSYARTVKKVSNSKAQKMEEKKALSLDFQQDAVVIRTADGRMRLVNQ